MKVKVNVTQEHIRDGCHDNAFACPVALALRDAGCHAGVTEWSISIRGNCLPLPRAAAEFVRRYDRGDTPPPFTFELDLPDHTPTTPAGGKE